MKTWTDEEIEILTTHYCTTTKTEISRLIPNKSYLGIYKKAKSLGLTRSAEIESANRKETARAGSQNNLWKGGVMKSDKGYKLLRMPEHHRAKSGYVFEHIYVFEKETGIKVPHGCCIHHLNGIKDDNRIENLCLMTHSAHTAMHHLGSKRTEETKQKISEKAKQRYKNHKSHPRYKSVDIRQMISEVEAGQTVKSVCAKYNINKTTYYKKIRNGEF